MNLKKMTIALALVLTMFAINAKAQNNFGEICPVGSITQDFPISKDDPDNCLGVDIVFKLCWTCPSIDVATSFAMTVLEVKGLPPTPVIGCDWRSVVEKYITRWSFISTKLCPNWSSVPPCEYGVDYYKTVVFQWPTCWHFDKALDGSVSVEPCLPVECLCVGSYKYCYENGIIQTFNYADNCINVPPYIGPCPPIGDCAIYTAGNVPWSWGLGTSSPCFHICE